MGCCIEFISCNICLVYSTQKDTCHKSKPQSYIVKTMLRDRIVGHNDKGTRGKGIHERERQWRVGCHIRDPMEQTLWGPCRWGPSPAALTRASERAKRNESLVGEPRGLHESRDTATVSTSRSAFRDPHLLEGKLLCSPLPCGIQVGLYHQEHVMEVAVGNFQGWSWKAWPWAPALLTSGNADCCALKTLRSVGGPDGEELRPRPTASMNLPAT